MRLYFTILLLFSGWVAVAQVDSAGVKKAMMRLDKALLEKDAAALNDVLHDEVSYGHSNGWVQTKQDILNDLKSGKLVYAKIVNNSVTMVSVKKKWATVSTNTNVEGMASEKSFQLLLHVWQVWTKTKQGWQLWTRQSVKLN